MILDQQEQQHHRRDLGQQQDLQLGLDFNEQDEIKDLRAKIIFSMQGLGSVKAVDQHGLTAYIKDKHCEESIKDLVKSIRRDVPSNPKSKLILADFNIFQSDLIDLLILQLQDKKLSFWILALMALLTTPPSQQLMQHEKEKIYETLRNYKKSMLRRQSLNTLTIHIADYYGTQVANRSKAHLQMMEFIILLLKNLLVVPSQTQSDMNLHSHFIITMIKQQMFDPLFYILQTQKSQLLEKIDIPLLQIFFHTLTSFNPDYLFQGKQQKYKQFNWLNKSNKQNQPKRHSRFMPNFVSHNKYGNKKIYHNLDKPKQAVINQKKAPIRTAQYKKVKKLEQNYLDKYYLELEMQVNEGQVHTKKTIQHAVNKICNEFIAVEFSMLSQLVFNTIYKQTPKVNHQHVIKYMILCSWAMQLVRKKYQYAIQSAKNPQQIGMVEFDLTYIACVMQTSHFELIYKILFREATRQKKKDFKINMFNAGIVLFLNYLGVIEDISKSFNMNDRKNANILMGNIFRHDIARVFKIGFNQINHEGILENLITLTFKFFKLLTLYSKGKVLSIQTNRLLKQKNKKANYEQQNQLEGFISQDSDDNNSQSYNNNQNNQQKKKKKKQKTQVFQQEDVPLFHQRRFNEISQFAIIAQYNIISKYLIFFKSFRFLRNSKELNAAIFFFIDRIVTLLQGQWLFFQAETLTIFQQILSETNFCRMHKEQAKSIRYICLKFIKLFQKNKLALVESLFRFGSLTTKQRIMNNYEIQGDDEGILEQNMFVD